MKLKRLVYEFLQLMNLHRGSSQWPLGISVLHSSLRVIASFLFPNIFIHCSYVYSLHTRNIILLKHISSSINLNDTVFFIQPPTYFSLYSMANMVKCKFNCGILNWDISNGNPRAFSWDTFHLLQNSETSWLDILNPEKKKMEFITELSFFLFHLYLTSYCVIRSRNEKRIKEL